MSTMRYQIKTVLEVFILSLLLSCVVLPIFVCFAFHFKCLSFYINLLLITTPPFLALNSSTCPPLLLPLHHHPIGIFPAGLRLKACLALSKLLCQLSVQLLYLITSSRSVPNHLYLLRVDSFVLDFWQNRPWSCALKLFVSLNFPAVSRQPNRVNDVLF